MSAPKGHWLLGHIPGLRDRPLQFLSACEAPMARLRMGVTAWLLLEPQDIAHVLEHTDDNYTKGRAFHFGKKLYGNSLLISEGKEHQQQVREFGSVFFRHAAHDFLEQTPEISLRLLESWQADSRLNLYKAMLDLMIGISSQAVFGDDWLPSWLNRSTGPNADSLLASFDAAMAYVAEQNFSLFPLPDWIPTPRNRRYRKAIDRLNEAFAISLRKRRSGESSGGFLSRLLAAHNEQQQPFTDTELRDQSLIFLLGGYESSATSLSWMFLLLDHYEEIRNRVLEEIKKHIGDRLPEAADARKLTYTGQFISESLRLYPAPWLIPRSAKQADQLPSGIQLPAGALIFLSPWRTHRDVRFFPKPTKFDPERFAKDREQTWPEGAYFPFSYGSRRCTGETISRQQMALILATLLPRVRLRWHEDELPAPKPVLTLRPPNPLWVQVEKR